MATEYNIGGSGALFVGEVKTLVFEVLDGNPSDAASLPLDITGWDLHFVVRKKDNTADPALLDITASIAGVYNPVRASNLQRASVPLTHAQLLTFKAADFRYSFARETLAQGVINYGKFSPEKATAL